MTAAAPLEERLGALGRRFYAARAAAGDPAALRPSLAPEADWL